MLDEWGNEVRERGEGRAGWIGKWGEGERRVHGWNDWECGKGEKKG